MITCALWDIESLVAFYLILGTLYPIEHTWPFSNPYMIVWVQNVCHATMSSLYLNKIFRMSPISDCVQISNVKLQEHLIICNGFGIRVSNFEGVYCTLKLRKCQLYLEKIITSSCTPIWILATVRVTFLVTKVSPKQTSVNEFKKCWSWDHLLFLTT